MMKMEYSGIQIAQKPFERVLEIKVEGKLTEEDYESLIPQLEQMMERYGKIRILAEFSGFHGWTASALWEDTKFAFRHFRDIERLAIVGENNWEKGMAYFCKPFTTAEVRYFEKSRIDEARNWISENLSPNFV